MQTCKQDTSSRVKSLSMGLALFAAQAAFSLAAHAQTSYQLTPLGSLGGGFTEANAINSVGDVVGCSLATINGTSTLRAFVYSNGQMMDIGSLTNGGTACAQDINDSGQITGNSATPTGESRGFIYKDGTMTSLGNAGTSSEGNSINNAGLVTGSARDLNGNYAGSFLYDEQLSPPQVDIGTLNGIITQARSINAAGDIAGWAVNADSRGTSFLYQNGVITDLGLVLGFPSQAMAINDLGQVVGSRSPGGGYLYDNGTVTTLPSLGDNDSSPVGLNNVGQIVGSAWAETGNHAVVIAQGQIVDLNDAIVASSPDQPFVTLEGASGINDNGWIIASGLDHRTGVRGAYLLRPVTVP